MVSYFPGTVVERSGRTASDFLFGVFSVTKGLVLAQVKEITGLETPAVQNWVNRGWIQKPLDKRYSADHLARIMIFNMLRDVMRFEQIEELMTYINGHTDDGSDDIISDAQLYIYICDILDRADYDSILDERKLNALIETAINGYKEPFAGAKEKLVLGLHLILVYYASAIVRVRADRIFSSLFKTGGGNLV